MDVRAGRAPRSSPLLLPFFSFFFRFSRTSSDIISFARLSPFTSPYFFLARGGDEEDRIKVVTARILYPRRLPSADYSLAIPYYLMSPHGHVSPTFTPPLLRRVDIDINELDTLDSLEFFSSLRRSAVRVKPLSLSFGAFAILDTLVE